MNLTDFYFLCAFAVILVIYYVIPHRYQWCVILVSSIAYYLAGGHPVLILYPLISVIVSWGSARTISGTEDPKKKKTFFVISIIALLAVLILLKYLKFTGIEGLLVPLGLSYYTFTLIGYIADVYNGITEPEENLFKLITFGMYFPALVSGPIMQYRVVSGSFFEEHDFNLDKVKYGLIRMLWGFFKKLVVAQRLSTVVAVMFADPNSFGGRNVWLSVLLFTFQLYSDFSGLMDIVLGISECFGIKLPENFDTPFFARTISEYWRRWHITLGVWFKEYVFYPVLRTKTYRNLQNALVKRLGKKTGKQIATFAGMFVLWLTVGLWHGGNPTYIIGSGLLHWLYIVLEESLEGPFTALWKKLKIDPKSKVLEVIRVIRTFVLVNIGNLFFRSKTVAAAIYMIRMSFSGNGSVIPWMASELKSGLGERGIRAVSDVTLLGISYINLFIALFGIVVLMAADLYKRITGSSVRDVLAKFNTPVRFVICFAFLFMVILLAEYGPGYSSAEFIYQGF